MVETGRLRSGPFALLGLVGSKVAGLVTDLVLILIWKRVEVLDGFYTKSSHLPYYKILLTMPIVR